jgi:cell division septum initiation protein DivIVA
MLTEDELKKRTIMQIQKYTDLINSMQTNLEGNVSSVMTVLRTQQLIAQKIIDSAYSTKNEYLLLTLEEAEQNAQNIVGELFKNGSNFMAIYVNTQEFKEDEDNG